MADAIDTGTAVADRARAVREGWAYLALSLSPFFMTSNVVIGRAVVGTVPPIGLAFWRWVLAALILLPFAYAGIRRHRRELVRQAPLVLLLGALGMGICGAVVYAGLADTTATNAGLIYAASPMLICLLAAVFLRERITPRQLAGIVLAAIGVVTVLTRGSPEALLEFRFNPGDLWILVAVVSWAIYSLLIRRLSHLPTITVFAVVALAGVVVLAPFYAVETAIGRPFEPSWEGLLSVAGVALFSSVLAFSTYQHGIAVIGPSRAGVFMYGFPVTAALMAVIFLGEAFRLFHLAGLCLILPGVVMATLPGETLRRWSRRR
ncbi:MAG: DMT family transporter [Azospirillaceae bacterium]